jgi:hypothetical protein
MLFDPQMSNDLDMLAINEDFRTPSWTTTEIIKVAIKAEILTLLREH